MAQAAQVSQDQAVDNEQTRQIRSLQEEIELQGMLIQGRTVEIKELQERLAELQAQAKLIPDFSYQSLLVERIPSDLAHTIAQVQEQVNTPNKEEVFLTKLNQQNQNMVRVENQINELTRQIEIVGMALDLKSGRLQSKAEETSLPQSAGVNEEQNQAETKLIQLKAEIDLRRANVESAQSEFEKKSLQWYSTQDSVKIEDQLPKEAKKLQKKTTQLLEEQNRIQSTLAQLAQKEQNIVQSQKDFMEQKLGELEGQLEKMENPSESSYQALVDHINEVRGQRDSLIRDLSSLQALAKQ